MRLPGRPGQRVVDVTGVDQLANERALLGRARQGREQREELLSVLRPGVVLQRSPEGQVLGLGLLRDLVNIGRDESEGILPVARVLGQMKTDAADHVPDRALLLQVSLDPIREVGGLGGQGRPDVGPQPAEHRGRDQIGARHGRGRLGESRELVRCGIGHDQRPGIGRIQRTAGPGHDRLPDVTPVGQRRVELRLQLSRAQVEHPVPATEVERPEDALLHSGGQPGRPSSGEPG